jgi:REP element-mobilizing transposase RayT
MPKQYALLKNELSSYGGILLNTRKARQKPRPLAVRESMHVVLRSSKAKGEWSFKKTRHENKISAILHKFAEKYHVHIFSLANVGNHLHLHIQLGARASYKPFIRAVTGAIAQAVTKASRVNRLAGKFWDYRPFTRIVKGFNARLTLGDYIRVNQMEGLGYKRAEAHIFTQMRKSRYSDSC